MDYKPLLYLSLLALTTVTGCSSRQTDAPAQQTPAVAIPEPGAQPPVTLEMKEWNFSEEGFSIKLPAHWTFEGSIINNEKGQKVGELSPGLVTPLQKFSCTDYINRRLNGGQSLVTKELTLSFDNEMMGFPPPVMVKRDSMQLNNRQWFLLVADEELDGDGSEQAPSVWRAYTYCTSLEDKFFGISFFEYGKIKSGRLIYEQIIRSLDMSKKEAGH